jgi:membrane protein
VRRGIPPIGWLRSVPALNRIRGYWGSIRRFYWKAFEDNLTGLSAMVAYNLLLSILPVTLLALFVAGRVLKSADIEQHVLQDLRHLFPDAARSTLTGLLHGLQDFSTRLGIAAGITSVWIGLSFWGALDTAFCRIYRGRCRTWLEQKRFALAMLLVALLFTLTTIVVPTAQSLITSGAEDLPFGLSDVPGLVFAATLVIGLLLLFGCLCAIYWAVPNSRVRWRAIWPGAIASTVAITIVDYAFPFYLTHISTIERFGTTLVFVVIVLLWFYVLAIIILAGAVINAMRLGVTGDAGAFPDSASA